MVKTNWLINTVMVGLIPFIVRLFVFLFYKGSTVYFLFNEIDFILFGLVLNLSNINELEDKKKLGEKWEKEKKGVSLYFIIIFSTFLMLAYLYEIGAIEQFNKILFKIFAITISLVAFLNSYSIFNRINNIANGQN
ncbi:MAG: hypothetical protein FWH23_04165 [Bacteroidales bacterium]|nr:hypothetical protein [Bacteroidales bacterium]MCL2133276.1 hypothetical protein [Bacteroidales bacterium]